MFTLGMVLGGAAYALSIGGGGWTTDVQPWRLLAGGVPVGVGIRLGKGGTSGHGVCGVASALVTSITNVATFLAVAIGTALLVGAAGSGPVSGRSPWFWAVVLTGGLLFGCGLAVSHLVRPEVVLDFLQIEDLGLLFVMGGAAVTLGVALRLVPRVADRAPLTGAIYGRRARSLDADVVVGGAIFGAGCGLSGICRGAGYAGVGIGNWPVLWAVAGMYIEAYALGFWRSTRPAGTAAAVAD